MKEFTKEEISLCKQVAEMHRTSIKKGAWIIQEERADIPLLVIETISRSVILNVGYETKFEARYEDCVLLWTISDCLEFFKKRLWKIEYWHDSFEIDWMEIGIICCVPDPDFVGKTIYRKGKTPLEACLKAVLAVLEEEEK